MTAMSNVRARPFSPARAIGIIAMTDAGLRVSRHDRAYALAWAEDYLAQQGIAVVPLATLRICERLERGESVSGRELEAALYAIWSGPISEYHAPPKPEEFELA